MRQQRPTALILAVSLALFANAALAQRSTTGGVAPIAVGFEAPVIGIDPAQGVVTGAPLAPSYTGVAVTRELDRATRKELAKERTAARTNRQLLTSITPRTNVDRTDQMPDDPIPVRY